MKKILTDLNPILTGILLISLVVFSWPSNPVKAAQPAKEADPICDTGRLIQVSGTAVVNVTPDRVLIHLGVQSNGATPQSVEKANSATINRVIQALKAQQIEDKDIVTDWYVIEPVYDGYESLYIKGYRIHNTIAITLRDLSQVNQVLIEALSAGANQVVRVEFYLSDLRTYRDQARDLAMNAAREKAQDLAEAAGAQTGCVMSINENTWSYYNGGWFGQSRDLWTQNTTQNIAPSGTTPLETGPVDLGQIAVRAEVNAAFSLN